MSTPADVAMRLLVERVADYAIFTLDPEGHITSWNPAAERLKGYREDEVIGRHYSLLYVEDDVKTGMPQNNLRIAAERGGFHGEGRRRKKDGSVFEADVEITPLAKDGRMIGFAKIVRDISERVRAQERLHQANRDLDQFAAIAAHDLQEPLRMVTRYLALLERTAGSVIGDQGRGYIAQATDGAQRMHRLIAYLLTLARVGRESAPMAPVDMGAAWQEVVDNHSLGIEEAGALVSSDRLPTVLGHRDHIIQLLQNLLSNSLKYLRAGVRPEIRLSFADDGRPGLLLSP